MMKALYSGVSGMRSHQTKMDVIGNNIANVNTYGYKTQRTTFRDVYYQTLRSPGAPNEDRGGTNASQVGYGAQVGSVDIIHTISGYSPTYKSTDLYINGDGYLAVLNTSGDTLYTRLGALNFDEDGNLVDVNGSLILGYDNDPSGTDNEIELDGDENIDIEETLKKTAGPIKIADFKNYKNITINSDGSITAVNDTDDTITTIGFIPIFKIPNQDALILEGNSYYSVGNNAGTPIANAPGAGGTGALVTGGLEMSNVDLANEFSEMIVTQRGFQANTKIITVVDQMLEELVNLKR
jgi:flagellar hook protein FlgE